MATYIVWTYRCPRCRLDIGRRFGLITKPYVICPGCELQVRLTNVVIQQNWGFNFAWVSGLFIWFVLAVSVLNSHDFAKWMGGNTFPANTPQDRMLIAATSGIWAMLIGLCIGGVGMFLGMIYAAAIGVGSRPDPGFQSFSAPPPPGQPVSPGGGFTFQPPVRPGQPAPQAASAVNLQGFPSAAQPRARQRGCLMRGFFVLFWPAFFFIATGVVLAIVAMSTVPKHEATAISAASAAGLMASPFGPPPFLNVTPIVTEEDTHNQLKQLASGRMGEKSALWLFLGMLVVFILGLIGWLPWTGPRGRESFSGRPECRAV